MALPSELRALTTLARDIGGDVAIVQGGGGNFSFKDGCMMYVKASGVRFDAMDDAGYALVDYTDFRRAFLHEIGTEKARVQHEEAMNQLLTRSMQGAERPSMESAMHCFLPKFVLHTHAVVSNILLCMEGGERIIQKLFHDVPFMLLPYASPGYALGKLVAASPPADILFLQNHGMIVCGDTVLRLKELLTLVINRCTTYLQERLSTPIYFTKALVSENVAEATGANGFLFPDAVVYAEKRKNAAAQETLSAQRYIEETIRQIRGVPRYIPKEEVKYLRTMEAEKYRQQKV